MTTDERLRALEDAVRVLLTQQQLGARLEVGLYRALWDALHPHGAPAEEAGG